MTLKLNLVFAAMVAALASVGAHAVDAFDPGTNLLTLDRVSMIGTTYPSVAVIVNSYSLQGVAGGAPAPDTFDPASNILTLGSVGYQGTMYNNVTVKINAYDVRSVGGAGTPGTLATPTYTNEMAGYLATLNDYRTQCGIPALSQNTILDAALFTTDPYGGVNSTLFPQFAAAAGYALPSTVADVGGAYSSASHDNALVGRYEVLVELVNPWALFTMMRPYTEIGLRAYSGINNYRQNQVMLGNPVSRNQAAPVTFPCANTTDVPPAGVPPQVGMGASFAENYYIPRCDEKCGTPIAVLATPGDSLVITGATVTAQGGAAVPVTVMSANNLCRLSGCPVITMPANPPLPGDNEGLVWPQQPLQANTPYDVVIGGTVNGVGFARTFTFHTGAAIVSLP